MLSVKTSAGVFCFLMFNGCLFMKAVSLLLVFGSIVTNAFAQSPALVDTIRDAKPLLKLPSIEDSHMNILLNTSFTSDADENGFQRLYGKMNYLKWEMKGSFGEDFFYHYRQSLTKDALRGEADRVSVSVDYANIGWNITPEFSLVAGKQLLALGGYEFWVSGYKVQEFSEFNDLMNNYGTGVTFVYRPDALQSFSLQVVGSKTGSDDETFVFGLPENRKPSKFPLLATLNWERYCMNREMNLRYSVSAGQQAENSALFYFTSGHVFRRDKWLAYWDVNMSFEGVDHKGLISSLHVPTCEELPVTAQNAVYFTTIANVDYRISDFWNVYLKSAYEMGGITSENACFRRGTYFHEWQIQACVEYYPKREMDLKFYAHFLYKNRNMTNLSLSLNGKDTWLQRVALGVVYAIPVF